MPFWIFQLQQEPPLMKVLFLLGKQSFRQMNIQNCVVPVVLWKLRLNRFLCDFLFLHGNSAEGRARHRPMNHFASSGSRKAN